MNIQDLSKDLQAHLLNIVADHLDDCIYGLDVRELDDIELRRQYIKDLQLTYSLHCRLERAVKNG